MKPRPAKLYAFRGRELSLRQWADELGHNYQTLKSRVNRLKWPIEVVLSESTLGPGRRGSRTPIRARSLPSSRLQTYLLPLEFTQWARLPPPLYNEPVMSDTPAHNAQGDPCHVTQ